MPKVLKIFLSIDNGSRKGKQVTTVFAIFLGVWVTSEARGSVSVAFWGPVNWAPLRGLKAA